MSKKEKRVKRLLSRPRDMRYEEVRKILEDHGFQEYSKKSGSHSLFSNGEKQIDISTHNKKVKKWILEDIIDLLNLED